jgi:pimeloyl-ACP methyl ester carboxylesterase
MTSLPKIALAILLVPVALYALACLFLFTTQRSHIYFPVPRHETTVPTLALRTEAGDVLVSTRALAGSKAVVYFGGNGEDVSQTVPDLAMAFPDRAIHALHYRGYGGSAGTPGEKEIVADALALFDQVHAQHDDIVVVGRSLGSGVAVQVAGARPATRLVLVTPYDSLAAVAASHYPVFPVRWLMRDQYDSVRIAPNLALPTTIIAAGRDEVIPMANTRRLQAAFRPGVAKFVLMPDEYHNFAITPAYHAALRGEH